MQCKMEVKSNPFLRCIVFLLDRVMYIVIYTPRKRENDVVAYNVGTFGVF